ncbi:hypothetical protein CDAR_404211 [Caerostris darwini]|uniref:Uncharacterized protein n=1 Tax=Caerostris darwini TaxID=1538125 RepID=A0AAV4SSE5_9ARAC|nr:hypothetical protein CDAR_404211 [Caerostris darwini]
MSKHKKNLAERWRAFLKKRWKCLCWIVNNIRKYATDENVKKKKIKDFADVHSCVISIVVLNLPLTDQ